MKPYNIILLNPAEFVKKQFRENSLAEMLEWVGYPKILRTGYVNHIRREIVLCLGFADVRTLYHEIGHELGLMHDSRRESVMYYNIRRGYLGIPEIDDAYYEKYGFSAWRNLIEIIGELNKWKV